MAWFEHGASRIYFEEHGKGETVLLLPGFSQSASHLAALRDALAAHSRVIAADLPGSGRSQPQPRAYTATYYADDARAFAALLEHLTIGQASIVGFSDGGEVALLMAELAPARVRSVVTWGAAGAISDPEGHLREAMSTVVDHPIPPLQGYRDFLVSYYGEENARAMTQSVAGAFGAIIAAGGDISRSRADQITCPVLLITGEHDMFAPPALVQGLATRIPHAELSVVEGAGHSVQDSHPDWLAQTVFDWLARH